MVRCVYTYESAYACALSSELRTVVGHEMNHGALLDTSLTTLHCDLRYPLPTANCTEAGRPPPCRAALNRFDTNISQTIFELIHGCSSSNTNECITPPCPFSRCADVSAFRRGPRLPPRIGGWERVTRVHGYPTMRIKMTTALT